MDKNLNWKAHIDYISSKISKACGIISKLRYSVSTKLLVEIYNALIHSYLRYGIVIWGNTSEESLKPLNTLVNRAVKIMSFTYSDRTDLEPIFSDLKVLSLKNVFRLETAKYMYKLKNDLLPTVIGNYFETRSEYCMNPAPRYKFRKRKYMWQINPAPRYKFRKRNKTNKIDTRLKSSEKSIQIRGEKIWSEIPESLRKKKSINSFKKHYKSVLLRGPLN